MLDGGKFAMGFMSGIVAVIVCGSTIGFFGLDIKLTDSLIGALVGGLLTGLFTQWTQWNSYERIDRNTKQSKADKLGRTADAILTKLFLANNRVKELNTFLENQLNGMSDEMLENPAYAVVGHYSNIPLLEFTEAELDIVYRTIGSENITSFIVLPDLFNLLANLSNSYVADRKKLLAQFGSNSTDGIAASLSLDSKEKAIFDLGFHKLNGDLTIIKELGPEVRERCQVLTKNLIDGIGKNGEISPSITIGHIESVS